MQATPLDVVRVRVPAKLNLALCVDKPVDGFHPLQTIFQAVSLFDELTIYRSDDDRIEVSFTGTGADELPTDGTDLVGRAARLLRETYGTPDLGVCIEVAKRIPIAGGMAGGSANAAATLLGCAALWDLDTPPDSLSELAAQLGSDVPFALLGGTALGTGRGDQVLPVLTRGTYHWVLAIPQQGLNTAAVFAQFDKLDTPTSEFPMEMLSALASGDSTQLGAHLVNDLQAPAIQLYPDLGDILLLGQYQAGVQGSLLSGSGSTCAFLVDSLSNAKQVAVVLAQSALVRDVLVVSGPVPGAALFL